MTKLLLLLATALTLLVIPALLCIFNEVFGVDLVKPTAGQE